MATSPAPALAASSSAHSAPPSLPSNSPATAAASSLLIGRRDTSTASGGASEQPRTETLGSSASVAAQVGGVSPGALGPRSSQSKSPASLSGVSSSPSLRGRKLLDSRTSDMAPSSPMASRRRMSIVRSPWALDDESIDAWGDHGLSGSNLGLTRKMSSSYYKSDRTGGASGEVATRNLENFHLDAEQVDESGSSSSEESQGRQRSRDRASKRSSTTRLLEAMAPIVPTRIVEQGIALANEVLLSPGESPRSDKIPLFPMRLELEGAVLFSDISGFSKLAERLVLERKEQAKRDRTVAAETPAEKLSNVIGQGLNNMIQVITESGGDVIKFAGDAILAMFAAEQFGNQLERACLVCAQVALRLSSLHLNAGKEILRVHSGVGCGRIAWYQIGGEKDFWHYFIAGAPVTQIGLCEHQAGAGEVVISADARVQMEKISPLRGSLLSEGNFKLVEIMSPEQFLRRDPNEKTTMLVKYVETHPKRQSSALSKVIQSFLSAPAVFAIKMNSGLGLAATELRLCSTLFVKFRNFALDSDSPVDLQVVQYIVKELVTKIVLSLEGTVCRLSVDDKGAIMLLAFGLVPFAHPNDSARAVKAALLIRDGMASLSLAKSHPPSEAVLSSMSTVTRDENHNSKVVLTSVNVAKPPFCERGINCQIGITRGKVCVGLVGGPMRCEYTMHGVLVNRAARLMSAATDFGILCDPDTFHEAQNEVEFGQPVRVGIKGEDQPITAYVPQRKITLSNPVAKAAAPVGGSGQADDVDRDSEEEGDPFIGRPLEKTEVDRNLKLLKGEDPYNAVVGVQGEPGMGKSKFLSYVIQRAKRNGVHALHGFALDTEFTTSFFAWKPVVFQLINLSTSMQLNRLLVSNSSGNTMKSFGSASSGVGDIYASATSKGSAHTSHNDSKGSIRSESQRLRVSTLERTLSTRRPSKDTGLISLMAPSSQLDIHTPRDPPKAFVDMNGRERLAALMGAMPLEGTEKYPLLAEILEGVIDKDLMADNDMTQNLHGGHRSTAITDLLVEMVVTSATKLQMRGERLILVMEDLHFMDRESLFTLNQLVKASSRLVLFVSDRSFDRKDGDEEAGGSSGGLGNGAVYAGGGGGGSRDDEGDPGELRLKNEELNFQLKEELMSDKSNVIILKLTQMDESEIRQCMCRWLLAENIPDSAVKFIHEKSAGNPLFAQELCYLLRDNKILSVDEGSCNVTGDLDLSSDYEIPNTIAALMTSNLDRIPAKCQAVLRLASVIGMIFQKNELIGVMRSMAQSSAENSEDQLTVELRSLAVANEDIDFVLDFLLREAYILPLVDNRPISTGEKYQFRHVLLKDTVCGLMGYEWKKNLHNHVARYYESRQDKDLNLMYNMAHHYYLAGNFAQARKYYELCGNDLGNTFAMQRVLECFLILLEIAPDAPPLQRAIWWRKVGETHMHLRRAKRAEDALYEGLRLLGLDCREADGVEGERLKGEVKSSWCSCWPWQANSSSENEALGGGFPGEDGDDFDDENASNGSSSVSSRQQVTDRRRRRLSVAEARGPLLPRLVRSLPAMVALRKIVLDKNISLEEKEPVVDTLLEASRIYCLMGELNKDRGSDEALERHLNAVMIAETAAMLPAVPDSRFRAVYQRCTDALARSYAPAAVFFAGMHPSTQWRSWAPRYGKLALHIQQSGTPADDAPNESQDSETPVLLNMRCGEFAAFQGDFDLAIELLRYALWGYRFMHVDNLCVETQILILAVYFFKGDLSNCNMIACELAQSSSSATTLIPMTLSACMLALCGEDVVAVQKLEQLVRSSRTAVKEGGPLIQLWPGLLQIKDPNAFLGFSLVEWRKNRDALRALKAALQAGITILHMNLTEYPLTLFHTTALVFTALWDPIREDPVAATSNDSMRRSVLDTLQRLLAVVRSYEVIYPACKPHTQYCVALRGCIVNKIKGLENGAFHGSLLFASQTSQGGTSVVASKRSESVMDRAKRALGCSSGEVLPEGSFYECARLAEEAKMVWVQGLALLECPDNSWDAWTQAYDIFSRNEYTTYELSRAHNLFVKNNLQLPPLAWVNSFAQSAVEM